MTEKSRGVPAIWCFIISFSAIPFIFGGMYLVSSCVEFIKTLPSEIQTFIGYLLFSSIFFLAFYSTYSVGDGLNGN